MDAVLQGWRDDRQLSPGFVLDEVTPARLGSYAPIPAEVAPQVREALLRRGIEQLFSHQAEAYQLARSGRSLVIATPTASGKSLCYNLPLLDRFAREPGARALYLFPTKALSRDQEESLRVFMREAGLEHGAITFDGDTPGDARRAARERSGVVLTNPDMLHTGILPHHANWARLFSNLRYVVIDELHTYRGVFGSHLANVLRRLQRVAAFHGSSPVFVLASATIGNPKAHAERMLGREVALVSESGAPAGERRVMVYNPPVVNAELGIRASYLKSAVRLVSDLVRAEVSTLLFGQSRNNIEVMLKYLRDQFIADKMDPNLIQGYRGGYLPGTRRATEAAMRAGEVRCVVATNALELGIDIGSLDAVVCAGYPGSVAALMQRFGRAGRRGAGSLALLVTSSAPLDQYLAGDPRSLTGAPVEHARIDPDNVEILVQHLKCAAFELPFEEGDTFGDVPAESTADALGYLAQHEVVHPTPGAEGKRMFHWSADAYPANHVSLRSVGWDNVVIIELGTDRTLAEMDFRSAHTMLHEQAIYQHEAEQYQVERFDYENHKAYVRKVAPDYFTDAMTYVRVNVIQEDQGAAMGPTLQAGMGEVSVIEKVVGYKKIKYHTHENVGYGDVNLPEMQMHTTSLWLTVPETVVRSLGAPRPAVIDALRGIASALRTVACVGLMIDPRDLGKTLGSKDDADGPPRKDGGVGFDPTIFLYDNIPGGVGLAARLFDQRDELLRRARRLLESCGCEDGCPACIGPAAGAMPGSAPVDAHPRKRLGLEILSALGVVALQ
ncbi:DEAD/DEAH box helicase [Archangium violaceum Cb vi76]|uniref:DEAD/DEAH box helicase n=1 Tax=Archangium violaceum Cb vi76 TaxID=1406225 RepID=A0A084SW29_9BACT|nr:DEAD/DEAH box helicase [Archangium violaceum Cb vi76]